MIIVLDAELEPFVDEGAIDGAIDVDIPKCLRRDRDLEQAAHVRPQ